MTQVLEFCRKTFGLKNFVLWGRSMGAATAIFYTSPVFRKKQRVGGEASGIKGLVLDSPFTDLPENIKNFVDVKASTLPGFVVDLAIKLIEGSGR